jgi:tetratricopeptide (TPR) repeat protein
VVDGVTYPDDTTMTALADAIAERARTAFVLRPGELYRLKQPYRGLGLSEVDREDARVTSALGDWFERVVDPATARARHVDALAATAKLLLVSQELDAAEARLREALALDPDHVEALFQAGWAAVMRDRWQDACVLFERASSRDARHFDARNNTAWALGRLGRWQEALAILDMLVVVRPDWKLVHTNRAWVLRGLGRVEEAVAADEKARTL